MYFTSFEHSYDHIKEKLDRLNKIIFLDYDNNYDFIENFEILINKIGCKKLNEFMV